MSNERIKELEREIELTKELIELQMKLNTLKNYQPIQPIQPIYPVTFGVPVPLYTECTGINKISDSFIGTEL
ncbi:MAG: hypothetical protein KGJ89_05140 [Patescibacteria group bacterium]|nr:hypothetical protein [Patescibacteria group bacterium]